MFWKIYFHFDSCICVCVYESVSAYHTSMCVYHVSKYPQSPEEGKGFCGAGITSNCELCAANITSILMSGSKVLLNSEPSSSTGLFLNTNICLWIPIEKECICISEAGLTVGCELPNVATENKTILLYKSCMFS